MNQIVDTKNVCCLPTSMIDVQLEIDIMQGSLNRLSVKNFTRKQVEAPT